MTFFVIRLLVAQGPTHLVRDGSAEHMQDLVSLVPGVEKPRRRLPNLRGELSHSCVATTSCIARCSRGFIGPSPRSIS